MKLRLGFVSNSSSSSFLVAKDSLNPEQYKKLIARNYKCTSESNLIKVYLDDGIENPAGKYMYTHYLINQDDEIIRLLKENIPFIALVDNAGTNIAYDGENTIYMATNVGITFLNSLPYLLEDTDRYKTVKTIEKEHFNSDNFEILTKEEYLKRFYTDED